MESVNFAQLIAQIDVEMQRLGWTIDQGREYLKKTYGKRSRFLLTQIELLDFLQYLESQPLEEVVTAKINLEIEQLCWTQDQGQINAEIQRLCWMKEKEEKEQKSVIKTSSKQSTNLLNQSEVEVIFQTDVEMRRLGWTPEQGREHLKKTYGKRGRTLLTEVELLDFFEYLVSLPTPVLDEALIAKINLEIERLCWTEKDGQGHLKRNYGKRSLTLLTQVELLDFFEYLVSLPTIESFTDFDAEYQEFQDFPTYSKKSDKVITKTSSEDLSQVLAKTDVEIQRLGWTPEQGREYLIKTYGKRGRTLLTEEELHQFLQYLQSQPDPIVGF
ncbi:hypothetical protein [Nostoc sp. 'Peltigera membranacea cyanobiont' N6]|uniref:hypothetical protein n=1 Tax=Nostoc sp. 'Peltigera membranacea cyanobiont' N6 TaxID=1261031 RepID=UPI000D0C4E28|nr:hypothetical protein [Nostoc sp. 'Peltigera membranacea cyanobiont' N6]AVH67700.1 hypothetical protein NPM_6304 [Nostoc sp. 'Peltigera membranacea cyanobiont' N6]